jgi:UrcA family protein
MVGSRKKVLIGLLVACLVAGAADWSVRANTVQCGGVRVSIAGLDLRTAKGEARLRHRVFMAAQDACDPDNANVTFASRAFQACVQRAVHGAAAQIDSLVAAARGTGSYVARTRWEAVPTP